VTLLLISLVAFFHFFLRAGRLALAGTGIALRALSTPFAFLSGDTLSFREIQSLHHIEFLGDSVFDPAGTVNPWMLLSHVGILLVLVFLVDATLTVWRRGQRGIPPVGRLQRHPVRSAGAGHAVLLSWGGWQGPCSSAPSSWASSRSWPTPCSATS
jgi:hypothetical protein